jgi:hypothetical protein
MLTIARMPNAKSAISAMMSVWEDSSLEILFDSIFDACCVGVRVHARLLRDRL